MLQFKGSVSNLPVGNKVLIWSLGAVVPILLLFLTIIAMIYTGWWPILLVPDLIAIIVALSFSGIIVKGAEIRVLEGEMTFRMGWSEGKAHLKNLIKVYRSRADGKDTVMIVFRDPASEGSKNRCITLDQMFLAEDRKAIFSWLKRVKGPYKFQMADDATSELISKDRKALNWTRI